MLFLLLNLCGCLLRLRAILPGIILNAGCLADSISHLLLVRLVRRLDHEVNDQALNLRRQALGQFDQLAILLLTECCRLLNIIQSYDYIGLAHIIDDGRLACFRIGSGHIQLDHALVNAVLDLDAHLLTFQILFNQLQQ